MDKISKYEWIIDQEMVEIFRKYDKGRREFSRSFNNKCWTLQCAPNGYKNIEHFLIGLKALSFPHKIKEMEIKIIIDFGANIFQYEGTKRINSLKSKNSIFGVNTKLTLNEIISKSDNSSFSIHCKIEIMAIWIGTDQDLEKIEGDKMEKYGITKS